MVSSTPRPHFTAGKDQVPTLQEAGWAPGPVWTGGNSRPNRDSISDRPARSQSLYRLSYPAHVILYSTCKFSSYRILDTFCFHFKDQAAREITVCCEHSDEHINALCGTMRSFLTLQHVVHT